MLRVQVWMIFLEVQANIHFDFFFVLRGFCTLDIYLENYIVKRLLDLFCSTK